MAHSPPAKRRRRDVAEARTAILDAAERRLIDVGPGGLRLQDVAAAAGVSHPNVLHHFGSREALLEAVIARCLGDMHRRLIETISASSGAPSQVAAIFESVTESLTKGGYGRLILWLALAGHRIDGGVGTLVNVVDAAHEVRRARARGRRAPSRDDTAHVVVLATLVLTSATVLLEPILNNVGLYGGHAGGPRFRAWLARLIGHHLGEAP